MTYKGIIKKIFHSGEKWSSMRVECDGQQYNISGSVSFPKENCEIEFEGKEIIDPKYGLKIEVSSSKINKENKTHGLIAYLGSGIIRGIRETTARKIVGHFKNNTLNIIENTPERLTEVSGISLQKTKLIHDGHMENKNHFDLYDLLDGAITKNQADKIIGLYGDKTIKTIKSNPYILIYELDGFGFLKTDAIAQSMGVKEDSVERIGAGVTYTLKETSEKLGHCYLNIEELQNNAIKVLLKKPTCLNDKLYNKFLKISDDWKDSEFCRDNFIADPKNNVSTKDIAELDKWIDLRLRYIDVMAEAILIEAEKERIVIEDDKVYWSYLYDAEVGCSKILTKLLLGKSIKNITNNGIERAIINIEEMEGYTLEDEQKEAVKQGVLNKVCVITGGPGRGKTTIIKTIIEAWGDLDSVVMCAPTGRAASRMTEITGREASTIQRLIYSDVELDNKLIIVDECSMIDISLAYELLRSLYNCNIIFVGDKDQLLSIGPGTFFKDLVESPLIPTFKLEKGHRNSGAISLNAESINNKVKMEHLIYDETFRFIECGKEKTEEIAIREYIAMKNKFGIKETCILAPMRVRSMSGTDMLNEKIRDIVNPYMPSKPRIQGCKFRVGDRIMQMKNNAKKEYFSEYSYDPYGFNSPSGFGIFNGDLGIVKDILPDDEILLIIFDDGRLVEYEASEFVNLTLAYAMTVHKSQGSENKGVILIHNKEHFIMLRKNLFYTGATRAKLELCLIGEREAFDDAISNKAAQVFGDYQRNTKFKFRLNDAYLEKKKSA